MTNEEKRLPNIAFPIDLRSFNPGPLTWNYTGAVLLPDSSPAIDYALNEVPRSLKSEKYGMPVVANLTKEETERWVNRGYITTDDEASKFIQTGAQAFAEIAQGSGMLYRGVRKLKKLFSGLAHRN